MNPVLIGDRMSSLRRSMVKFIPGWYKIGLAVIALVTVAYAVNFVNEVRHARELGAQVAAMRYEQAQIKRQNKQIAKAVAVYNTTAFAIEKAREWGYVGYGDQPVVVSVHYLKPRPHPVHRAKPVPPSPAWQQWWHAFFG